jgi:hypothetical protein
VISGAISTAEGTELTTSDSTERSEDAETRAERPRRAKERMMMLKERKRTTRDYRSEVRLHEERSPKMPGDA